MKRLSETYDVYTKGTCMHEFVISMEKLHKEKGVTATDIAKAMLDEGMHPPTMYFPLIVHEALMFEPTETEGKAGLDDVVEAMERIYRMAEENPEKMHELPLKTVIRRPDEVKAAREPVVRYNFEK